MLGAAASLAVVAGAVRAGSATPPTVTEPAVSEAAATAAESSGIAGADRLTSARGPNDRSIPDSAEQARSATLQPLDLARACQDDELGLVRHGHGTGTKVAVIGDSLSSQTRERMLTRTDIEALVAVHCGVRTRWVLDSGALTQVLLLGPEVLVVATGANELTVDGSGTASALDWERPDLASFDARLRDVQELVARTKDVPCVVWVNVAETPRRFGSSGRGALLEALAAKFNAGVDDALRQRPGPSAIADWDAVAKARPDVLADDGLHLSAAGVASWTELVDRTVAAACP